MKANLDYPILLKGVKNEKGFQYDMPYEKHSLFFDDVTKSMMEQTPLPFGEDISFKK